MGIFKGSFLLVRPESSGEQAKPSAAWLNFQLYSIQTESFSHLQEVTRTMQDFEADYVRLLLTKPPKNMNQTNSGMKKMVGMTNPLSKG